MNDKAQGRVGRFVRWLFGAPFRYLPRPFGDSVPADLRVFEAEQIEAQHHTAPTPSPVLAGRGRSKPARRREYLERQ